MIYVLDSHPEPTNEAVEESNAPIVAKHRHGSLAVVPSDVTDGKIYTFTALNSE